MRTRPAGYSPARRSRARSWVRKNSGWEKQRRMPRNPSTGFASVVPMTSRASFLPPRSKVRMVTGRPSMPSTSSR